MNTVQNYALISLSIIAVIAIIGLMLLFIEGNNDSGGYLPFLLECVPDSVAKERISTGDWITFKSSCCPQPHNMFGCRTNPAEYDLLIIADVFRSK